MIKQYYMDSYAQIFHADCRDILPDLEPVDLVLTDPPYGIDIARRPQVGGDGTVRRGSFGMHPPHIFPVSDWDKYPPSAETLQLTISKGRHAVIWGGNFFGLPRASGWLVWDKANDYGTNFADCELAWTNFRMAVRIFRWRWNGLLQEDMKRKEIRLHRTMKPLALIKWCIGFAPEAQSIIDPFMGSGTTLRAAKDMGIKAIGIEIDERNCEIAAERLRQESLIGLIEALEAEKRNGGRGNGGNGGNGGQRGMGAGAMDLEQTLFEMKGAI